MNKAGTVKHQKTMSDTSTLPKRLDSLTGLRAAAAAAVFLCHWQIYAPALPRAVHMLLDQGGLGVQFFFILSGFVLGWSHQSGAPALNFYRRRIQRLYPAYFVSLLFGLFVLYALKRSLPSLSQGWPSFLWAQSWSWNTPVRVNVSSVSWTLSVEAFFYLCFPAIMKRLVVLKDIGLRRVLLGAISIAVVWPVLLSSTLGNGDHAHWLNENFPPSRLDEFVIGCALSVWISQGGRLRLSLNSALMLSVIAVAAAAFVPSVNPRFLTVIPFTLVIAAAASGELSGTASESIWVKPMLVRAGHWSYCFYLFHFLVLSCILHFVGLESGVLGAIRFGSQGFVASLGVAALVYRFIEQPFADPQSTSKLTVRGSHSRRSIS